MTAVDAGTIVALAHALRNSRAFGCALLPALLEHVGADVGIFRAGDGGVPVTSGFSLAVGGSAGDPWTRHQRELAPVLAAAGDAGVSVDAMVLGQRRVRSTRYFSEVVRPHGGNETLFAVPRWDEAPAGCLVLGRCGAGGRFGRADVSRVHALLPAIALATSALIAREQPIETPVLSRREAEIVDLLSRGLSSRDIASVLGTSVNTVRNQVGRLMARLEVATRAELVARCRRP
jgi:DNA-binding CsgD family transcriptional regulator